MQTIPRLAKTVNKQGVERIMNVVRKFTTLEVTSPKEFVHHVCLNRPKSRNAMNAAFWKELPECIHQLSEDTSCRVIVISGNGKCFTAGLDLMDVAPLLMQSKDVDVARRAVILRKLIETYQETFSSLEKCPKPVITAVHDACIGAGVDLITAADIRYASQDAYFSVKEVDIGLAADVGTLQRLPKIVGNHSVVREWCYTARRIPAEEALRVGLISAIFQDKDSMIRAALSLAENIASKSPVAVQTTKCSLVYSRDHPVSEGLEHIRTLNQAMLQSEDLVKAATAAIQKETAVFAKL